MELLILLAIAAAGGAWYFLAGPGKGDGSPKLVTAQQSGALVKFPTVPGHWYRVTTVAVGTGPTTTAQQVVDNTLAQMKAQGFTGALGVLVKSNADGSGWGAQASGQYIGGQGGITSVPTMTILQVEEVAAPATTPAPAVSPATSSSGAVVTTLAAGQPQNTQTVALGTPLTVQLPPGASWVSQNGQPMSGAAPISWVYQGPGTIHYAWTAPDGSAQTTAFSVATAAPAAPAAGPATSGWGTTSQKTVSSW